MLIVTKFILLEIFYNFFSLLLLQFVLYFSCLLYIALLAKLANENINKKCTFL
uniref:Uncharacterized protein n=1 Tax=Ciona intestinalis TaxID=7719 RepID=H2Y194_CIOIN